MSAPAPFDPQERCPMLAEALSLEQFLELAEVLEPHHFEMLERALLAAAVVEQDRRERAVRSLRDQCAQLSALLDAERAHAKRLHKLLTAAQCQLEESQRRERELEQELLKERAEIRL